MTDSNVPSIRVGYGWDIHRLEKLPPRGNGKPLRIGGIEIEHDLGPVGKTDADVLLHAITDGLLGALALPSMGELFEKGDDRKGSQDSVLYLHKALRRVRDSGWDIGNLDSTVILERPKISTRKLEIRTKVSQLLECGLDQINVKMKTHEDIDSLGKGEAIEAHVVVLLYKAHRS